MTDHTPTPDTARPAPEPIDMRPILIDAVLEARWPNGDLIDGVTRKTAGLIVDRIESLFGVLIAAARESTPAPTEARFKWEPGQDHEFIEVENSTECGHPVDDPDVPYCGLPWGEHGYVAARTAPTSEVAAAHGHADTCAAILTSGGVPCSCERSTAASEVAPTNAEARLAAISELVETGQQFMTRNRFTDALRAILRDEVAATNAQSVISAAHVAQEVLRQNDRHFAELLAEADRIDGVMVNGTNVAAVLRNMVDEHESHA